MPRLHGTDAATALVPLTLLQSISSELAGAGSASIDANTNQSASSITMAALICDSFSKLCSGCTEACGSCCHVIAVPCQKLTEIVQQVVCSPFFPFLFVTILCNVPSIVSVKFSCTWGLVNAVFCGINILACFYMVHKLQKEKVLVQAQVVDESGGTHKTDYQTMPASETRLREAPAERLKQVLCYDAGVAMYIVIFILWLCWLTYGFQQSIVQDDCNILYGIFCGVCYIMVAGCAFGCSLLCLK